MTFEFMNGMALLYKILNTSHITWSHVVF